MPRASPLPPAKEIRPRTQADEARARLTLIPALDACRKHFDAFIGQPVNWTEAP